MQRFKLVSLVCAIAVVALFAMSATALASTTVYDNDFAGWQGAVMNYQLEDFGDATLNTGVSYASGTGFASISGGEFHDLIDNPNVTTWSFATPIYAFGGNWDLGIPGGPGTGIKVLINGSWVEIGDIPNGYTGQFWGFVSTEPFTMVRLEETNPSIGIETYDFDNLVYGGRWVRTLEAKVSEDLIAQQDTVCIPALVKVHPTLQLAIDKEALTYYDLNPATNSSVDLTCSVQVKSNLPFKEQVTITPFQFTPNGVAGDVLESYKYVDGQWVMSAWDPTVDGPEPGTGDTIPASMQSVFIKMINGVTGEVAMGETEVGANGVFPANGTIGDIDNHIWENEVRWHIGPINWCVTAGYYAGQMCVTVYQN